MLDDRLMEYAFKLAARLLDGRSRLQAAHDSQPPDARAIHVRPVAVDIDLRLPRDRDRHVLRRAGLSRPVKPRRRDADDRERNVVETDLLANDCRIAAEPSLPVTITKRGDRICRSLVVFVVHRATNHWPYAKPGVVIARHGLPAGDIGLPVRVHVQAHAAESEDF